MNQNLFQFYLNRKGYDMAINIPQDIADKLQPAPQPTPAPESK